ncbi:MAG: PASTA domain-containing protein [Sphingobacteriales bacterium]|nr:MAG: PASTA domain-containing protein [Sphingobacteriales bacterium]
MKKGDLKGSLRFNLFIILVVGIVLYVLFFASLGIITRHGNEMKVPNVTGKDINAATAELQKLGFEIDVDSTYEPAAKPYVVLLQIPEINAIVKEGRTIFLTINKAEPPKTPMPNMLGVSYRSAVMIIKSSRLVLGDTTYRPDIAKGAVLDQLYNGKSIRPGQLIPQGSRIDLVIGDGLGNTEFNVPDVIGMTYDEAIAILNSRGLNFTAIWEGEVQDSVSAVVFAQTPTALNELSAPNRIKEGDIVDIRIKQEASAEELENNRNPGATVIEDQE